MAFDILSAYDTQTPSEKGKVITITDPATGKPGVLSDGSFATITTLGPDCPAYRKHLGAAQRRAAEMARAALADGDGTVDPQATYENTCSFLADLSIAWNVQIGGTVPQFTKAAAKDLYLRAPALLNLVTEATGNRSDFLASPPSPRTTPTPSEPAAGSSS